MEEKKDFFPLFVSLEGKRICIAGAGEIAARRAKVLLSFGAELFVTAPECCAEMRALLREEFDGEERGDCGGRGEKEPRAEGSEKQEFRGEGSWSEGLQTAGGGKIVYRERCFEESDLRGMDLVLAATDDAGLNHEIALMCRMRRLPVNNASCRGDCDFFFPAILREDGLTIGVSSGGEDHRKVAETCGRLRRFFGKSL